jgi:hypothetical protein
MALGKRRTQRVGGFLPSRQLCAKPAANSSLAMAIHRRLRKAARVSLQAVRRGREALAGRRARRRLARDPEAARLDERFSALAAYIRAGEVVLSWHGKEKGPDDRFKRLPGPSRYALRTKVYCQGKLSLHASEQAVAFVSLGVRPGSLFNYAKPSTTPLTNSEQLSSEHFSWRSHKRP